MTVYLEDGVTPARARQGRRGARASCPASSACASSTRTRPGRGCAARSGARADLLDGVEEGFLPASIEVALKPGVAEVLRAHPAFERLRHTAGVEEVELMRRLGGAAARRRAPARRRRAGRWRRWSSAPASTSSARRSASACSRAATRSRSGSWSAPPTASSRRRSSSRAALQGALGTALAAALLYGLYRLASPRVEAVLGGWLASGPLGFFSPAAAGHRRRRSAPLLGLCGSALALGRYVKV